MRAMPTTNPARIDPEAYYDERSASLVTRVASSTLAGARRDGSLRHIRRGRSVYYRGEWLDGWMKAGEVPTRRDQQLRKDGA